MKDLKQRFLPILPILLSVVMIVSTLSVPARAEDGGAAEPDSVVSEQQAEITQTEASGEELVATKSEVPATEAPAPAEEPVEEPEAPVAEAPAAEIPYTCDPSLIGLWGTTLGASTLGLGALLLKRKKEEEEE